MVTPPRWAATGLGRALKLPYHGTTFVVPSGLVAMDETTHAENSPHGERAEAQPSLPQRRWLRRGLDQPGGKLPLFDGNGQRISKRTVRSCMEKGWAEPWFDNPIKPDWLVCKLTEMGRRALKAER
jgi:hypothetical protein